jgi:hypothetical protein
MKFPKIPKPLLIVIIIIVILGVVSCGAGVFRGLTEGNQTEASDAAGDGGLGLPSVKAGDVTVSAVSGGFPPSSCSKTNEDGESTDIDETPIDDITISTACDVTVEGQLLPQVLRMTIDSSANIAVQQEIGGRLQPDPLEFQELDDDEAVDISVTGLGQAHFRISCSSCLLRIAD